MEEKDSLWGRSLQHLYPSNLYLHRYGCGLTMKGYRFVSNPRVCNSFIKPMGCDINNSVNSFKMIPRLAESVEKWSRYDKIFDSTKIY
jgi:hypothetical protein